MFVNLLGKLNETEFKDVFQPLSPEEVESRQPLYIVGLRCYSKGGDSSQYTPIVKRFKIKGAFPQLRTKVAQKLGIAVNRFSGTPASNLIQIKSSDGIEDDNGRLMDGWCYIDYEEVD